MLFPIWPNGLAPTLVVIKRSPLILSKGLDGFTVLLQTADGAGRDNQNRQGYFRRLGSASGMCVDLPAGGGAE